MPLLSFVLPAKNESRYIGRCIDSINAIAKQYDLEVILVDNGSSDDTPAIASAKGAKVLEKQEGTIGGLRNFGVMHATGEILVFLDADVVLTSEWQRNFSRSLQHLQAGSRLITGSHCFAPEDDPLLFRTWFNSFASEPNSRHLGTGHLILRKDFFLQIGGFSEVLRTGEDYEFCVRAERAGAEIVNDIGLVVYHLDFPKNFKAFIRRESWHGRGDLQSWKSAASSKVVLASSVFLAFHLAVVATLFFSFALALLFATGIVCLLGVSSFAKFRHRPLKDVISNAYVFYWYYWGRVFSTRYLF